MSNPLKNTQKIQGGLAHQKCYARVQPGHSVEHDYNDNHSHDNHDVQDDHEDLLTMMTLVIMMT